MAKLPVNRWIALALLAAMVMLLPACQWDGQFDVFGYTTRPNYDEGIQTVYVPIFKNRTFRREIEFDLTKAVIREIEAKTPFKVVSNRESADSEILGAVVGYRKQLININPLGEVREAQTNLSVELTWIDLRPGSAGRPLSQEARTNVTGFPSGNQQPPQVIPILVQSVGTFIPEVGGSITSADKRNVDRIAIQIVSMMEKAW